MTYQLATEPVIRAEEIAVVSPAAVDLKSKLSAQHVQVWNTTKMIIATVLLR